MKIDCPLENYLKKRLHDPLYSILRVKAVIPTSQYNSVGGGWQKPFLVIFVNLRTTRTLSRAISWTTCDFLQRHSNQNMGK